MKYRGESNRNYIDFQQGVFIEDLRIGFGRVGGNWHLCNRNWEENLHKILKTIGKENLREGVLISIVPLIVGPLTGFFNQYCIISKTC